MKNDDDGEAGGGVSLQVFGLFLAEHELISPVQALHPIYVKMRPRKDLLQRGSHSYLSPLGTVRSLCPHP